MTKLKWDFREETNGLSASWVPEGFPNDNTPLPLDSYCIHEIRPTAGFPDTPPCSLVYVQFRAPDTETAKRWAQLMVDAVDADRKEIP